MVYLEGKLERSYKRKHTLKTMDQINPQKDIFALEPSGKEINSGPATG